MQIPELVTKLLKISSNEVRRIIFVRSSSFDSLGAKVIIACRNLDKGREAMEKLMDITACETKNIRLVECDLCSFKSVRHCAQLINDEEEKLDVLICNAGLGYSPQKVTEDGFNTVIQANYLSHFLLTNLLLQKLSQSKSSRIINVSSDLHQS